MQMHRIMMASISACLCLAATGAPVKVQDYIAKSTNRNDHTEAIRAAIAEAAQTRVWAVFFPGGSYTISDTIDISGGVAGSGSITQTNPEKDIFYSKSAWRQTVRGFSFHGGRDQVALGNHNVDQGFLVVSECQFFGANGVAVRFIRDKDTRTSSTYCLVEKCAFSDCAQIAVFVSDQSTMRDCWITTKVKKDNKAAIENYSLLTCQNILGVPHVSYTDQRWIDNYGVLVCKAFRFGGEGAGFTPVVNYAKGGSVKLEDSYVYALGNNKRACAVYLEEMPSSIVIKDCYLNVPAVKVSPKLDLKNCGKVHLDVGEHKVPEALIAAVAAAKERKESAVDHGAKQLSAAETEKALASAVAAAKSIPAAKAPGVMTYNGMKDGHRQVTDPAKYVEINPNAWDLNDTLDGGAELNSVYLALAPAGNNVVLMNRIDDGSYPHVRIRNITVDLDKTPYLTWRLKDNNAMPGAHQAMKVIDNATEQMTLLVDDYYTDQCGYYAYDLRQALGISHGNVNVDLKFFMCGNRVNGPQSIVKVKKGEYFLIDFMRLEAE